MNSKTCDDCSQYDEKIYNFDKKPELPRHPMCRCFYEIVDDNSINKIDYMSNRFSPQFGRKDIIQLSKLGIDVKKVSNSNFDMWTDIDVNNKNKAIRLYEKKLETVRKILPESFSIPRIAIIDFENNGLEVKAIGGYNRDTNTMFINNRYNTEKKIQKYLESQQGYFASSDTNAPLLHELGHKYHYDIVDSIANKRNMSYTKAKEIFDNGIAEYILKQKKPFDLFIKEELSSYAADSFKGINRMNEIMSEYFTVMNINDSDLVKYINDYIGGV